MKNMYFKYYSRKLRSGMIRWILQGAPSPAPVRVKRKVLLRNASTESTWIETGTYFGETASYLAKRNVAKNVISLEPSPELYRFAQNKWRKIHNLQILNESSESGFAKVIQGLSGNINFWLDGHNSGDITFLGEHISPIEYELGVIADNLKRLGSVTIFIDDIRLFNGKDGYPKKEHLVEWALDRELQWRIEHDIFIITSQP
jgi:hypothetical protein